MLLSSLIIPFQELFIPWRTRNVERQLDYGRFKGLMSVDGKAVTYYNIPFAAPPIGNLRFKAPQPVLNMTDKGTIDATKAGPSCMVDGKVTLNTGKPILMKLDL
jgi:carboxylesterase type B